MAKKPNRYHALIERVFFDHYAEGVARFKFARKELESAANSLGIETPKNLGDVIYAFRHRGSVPDSVAETQPEGMHWRIIGKGMGLYFFELVETKDIAPNPDLAVIEIPDATPELIKAYALADEQALLAIMRYNRLIDTFLGLTAYSLQSHLRTTVRNLGQIEIDELYIGLDKRGCHYAIPVQAKGGKDQIGSVQTEQDVRFVEERFPGIRCRAVAAQFMGDGIVALFELALRDGAIKIVEEKHYRFVSEEEMDGHAIRDYRD